MRTRRHGEGARGRGEAFSRRREKEKECATREDGGDDEDDGRKGFVVVSIALGAESRSRSRTIDDADDVETTGAQRERADRGERDDARGREEEEEAKKRAEAIDAAKFEQLKSYPKGALRDDPNELERALREAKAALEKDPNDANAKTRAARLEGKKRRMIDEFGKTTIDDGARRSGARPMGHDDDHWFMNDASGASGRVTDADTAPGASRRPPPRTITSISCERFPPCPRVTSIASVRSSPETIRRRCKTLWSFREVARTRAWRRRRVAASTRLKRIASPYFGTPRRTSWKSVRTTWRNTATAWRLGTDSSRRVCGERGRGRRRGGVDVRRGARTRDVRTGGDDGVRREDGERRENREERDDDDADGASGIETGTETGTDQTVVDAEKIGGGGATATNAGGEPEKMDDDDDVGRRLREADARVKFAEEAAAHAAAQTRNLFACMTAAGVVYVVTRRGARKKFAAIARRLRRDSKGEHLG